jgi:hypothetical protein
MNAADPQRQGPVHWAPHSTLMIPGCAQNFQFLFSRIGGAA